MRIFIFLVYFPIFFKFELSLINLGYFPSNQNRLRSIQPGMRIREQYTEEVWRERKGESLKIIYPKKHG